MTVLRSLRDRLGAEQGVTLIEVLVAVIVLTVGILALVSSFGSAQKLTLTAERRAALSHLAQREIERLQAVPYEELAMISKPEHSTDERNPDYYVNYSGATCTEPAAEKYGCYSWNAESPSEAEAIVVASKGTRCPKTGTEEGCGVVSASPTGIECSSLNPFGSCEWSDGRLSGDIYDFVTWHYDVICEEEPKIGEKLCSEQSYKRITVVVTVNVPSSTHVLTPVRVSTLIADPKAVNPNPLAQPGTTCGEPAKECTAGIGKGNAQSWLLHDSSATADESAEATPAPTKASTTHPTVAPEKGTPCEKNNSTGCPKPDFMDSTSPTAETLYDYSTDQDTDSTNTYKYYTYGTTEYGGRRLEGGPECNEEPLSTEEQANFKSEFWVTEPVAAETKLTASGGLSIYTQTIDGISGQKVTLCLALYSVPKEIGNLWATGNTASQNPEELAYTSYAPSEWPSEMQALSFAFEPEGKNPLISTLATSKGLDLKSGEAIIPAEHRIGLRIWPATISTSDISIAYDTAAQPALMQLNTE